MNFSSSFPSLVECTHKLIRRKIIIRLKPPSAFSSIKRGLENLYTIVCPMATNVSSYGPTETTIGNTMFPRVPEGGKPSNIGWQFDNVGSYVVDIHTSSPVLRGAVGELCIAGELVGPGYLNQPELTARKFPYFKDYSERVYRTGDIVRVLYDGSFDFIGRADDQVKLRGQRLEIAEINEVIKRGTEEISDVATLVIEHKKTQRLQLISFVTPSSLETRSRLETLQGETPNQLALSVKTVCQGKLPPYMVPTHIIPVTCIPLSSNNKIDHKRLKALYASMSLIELQSLTNAQHGPSISWSDTEKRVIRLLSVATNSDMSCITKTSNIFRLGLDSISVVKFAQSLKDAGFSNVQVSKVMQSM